MAAHMSDAKKLAQRVILESQIRGERSIAKARFILLALLAMFAVYVFVTAFDEPGRSVSSELGRAYYYVELACIALASIVSGLILKTTAKGNYSPWMRFVPSFIDITCVAALHWSLASSLKLCYSFNGAAVWLYILFVALSSIRNSAVSVIFTGAYATAAFLSLNTIFFSAMGNFAEGANLYFNSAGQVVKLDFEDEAIKAAVILAVTGILAVVSSRNTVLLKRQIELQSVAERYADTLKKVNASLERFIPREFLGFLRKDNILEVELGDWTECEMTIFFLDIRNFTALSENMSPRDNFRFLNSFLSVFGPIIRDHGGFVDKYPGDGIMALFPSEADEALAAALDMRERLREYNEGRARSGYVPIRFGIGIHSGPLMLGTIGENNRMDSTVISDTVNAASRIEGLNKKFSTDILVSGDTLHRLMKPDVFEARFVGEETVKGKARAVRVFELVSAAGAAPSDAI
jgi:class 3 adenylate cyclase